MQPLASLEALADPIYETFYGLREQPFATSTDPKFLFLSASHRRACEELVVGLKRREALLLLCGETGTGKTTLCRGVLEMLGPQTFSTLILNPYMAGSEMLRVVLRDFGFVSREEIRRGAMADADAPQLLDVLDGFLRALVPLDAHAVVVVDEAQSLAPEVLDQIRMLTALEDEGRRLLQIVLVGQPMLLQTLKTEPLYALNERITRRALLSPLEASEVDAYIRHRLEVAGGGDTVRFQADASRVIAQISRGLPRRVNLICDRSLQEGRIQGANEISQEMVKRAARSLAGGAPDRPAEPVPPAPMEMSDPAGTALRRSPASRWRIPVFLAVAAAVIGAAIYGGFAHSVLKTEPVLPQPPEVRLPVSAPPPAIALPSQESVLEGLAGGAAGSDELPDDRDDLDRDAAALRAD